MCFSRFYADIYSSHLIRNLQYYPFKCSTCDELLDSVIVFIAQRFTGMIKVYHQVLPTVRSERVVSIDNEALTQPLPLRLTLGPLTLDLYPVHILQWKVHRPLCKLGCSRKWDLALFYWR